MKTKKGKSQRRRVSREDVRKNAKDAGGSSKRWFELPEGVREWTPDKAGSVLMDVLPYEVTAAQHPDKVEKGVLWYKRPFAVHHNVGPANESVVCPASVGKHCPMCEERKRLAKNWDENEEQIKALNAQRFVAFNIKDPDDEDKVAVFAVSRGKFAVALEKELQEGDEDILNFYDVTDEGKTLKVRFSDATFEGRKYLQATRIDFRDRPAMDEDEVLGKTVCLDDMFVVMDYDKLKALFLQVDEDEETSVKKDKGKKGKPAPVDDDDEEEEEEEDDEPEEEDDDEEEEEEDKPPMKKGKGKPAPVEEDEEDEDDDDEEEDDEEGGEEDDDEEDEDDDEEAGDDEDEEEDEDEDEEPPAKSKGKKGKSKPAKEEPKGKKGKAPKCPVKGGTFGKDVDKYKECDKCEHWDACEDASG